jgi:hypothetical protein
MKLYELLKFIFMFLVLQFCTINSWKALRINAYFNSAMLWMYQIDNYALDLLAYFNSDGNIMSVVIAS